MNTEKTEKLSKFAQKHGYRDLESLYAAMDYEKNSALLVIAQMNKHVFPLTMDSRGVCIKCGIIAPTNSQLECAK